MGYSFRTGNCAPLDRIVFYLGSPLSQTTASAACRQLSWSTTGHMEAVRDTLRRLQSPGEHKLLLVSRQCHTMPNVVLSAHINLLIGIAFAVLTSDKWVCVLNTSEEGWL